jgi:hypothetical protein
MNSANYWFISPDAMMECLLLVVSVILMRFSCKSLFGVETFWLDTGEIFLYVFNGVGM